MRVMKRREFAVDGQKVWQNQNGGPSLRRSREQRTRIIGFGTLMRTANVCHSHVLAYHFHLRM